MGKPVSSRMLSAVRRLWGHRSTGPTAVFDQSMERISAPISPPPDRTVFRSECVIWVRRLCCTNLRREKPPVSQFCQSATKNAIHEPAGTLAILERTGWLFERLQNLKVL